MNENSHTIEVSIFSLHSFQRTTYNIYGINTSINLQTSVVVTTIDSINDIKRKEVEVPEIIYEKRFVSGWSLEIIY